jgi:hypothetical protein
MLFTGSMGISSVIFMEVCWLEVQVSILFALALALALGHSLTVESRSSKSLQGLGLRGTSPSENALQSGPEDSRALRAIF